MQLGMPAGSAPFAFGQLWTCIMISIKTEGPCPTVMKETPLSEPPLQTTNTSSRRPPLAPSAQVIKRSNLKKKREGRKLPRLRIVSKLLLTLGSVKFQINFGSQLTFAIHMLFYVSNIIPNSAEGIITRNHQTGAPIPTCGKTQLILSISESWPKYLSVESTAPDLPD